MNIKILKVLVSIFFSTQLFAAEQAINQAFKECQTDASYISKLASLKSFIHGANQNNYALTSAIALFTAIMGSQKDTGPIEYSIAAQKDKEGNYYCPSYSIEGMGLNLPDYGKYLVSNSGQLYNFFELSGNKCNIHIAGKQVNANNNLFYQMQTNTGYITNLYNSVVMNSASTDVGGVALSSAVGICDCYDNIYTPNSCMCATPGLSNEQINLINNCVWNQESESNVCIIMQCPICKYYYQAQNILVIAKYRALKFIFEQLRLPDNLNIVKTYCEQTNLPKEMRKPCAKYLSFIAPILPVTTKLETPWQYVINQNNQCDPTTATPPAPMVCPSAGASSSGPKAVSETSCWLSDQNKLYQIGDIFNYLHLLLEALKLDLKSDVEGCVQKAAEKAKIEMDIANNSYMQEKLEILNEKLKLAPIKQKEANLNYANNVMNVAVLADFILGGHFSDGMKKAGRAAFAAIRTGVQDMVNSGATRLEDLVENKLFANMSNQGVGQVGDAAFVESQAAAQSSLEGVANSIEATSTAETVGEGAADAGIAAADIEENILKDLATVAGDFAA